MAGVGLVGRPDGDQAEQSLAVADRGEGARPEAEPGDQPTVLAVLGPGVPRLGPGTPCRPLVQIDGAGGGQRPAGRQGRTLGTSPGEGRGMLGVDEVEDRREVDAGQPEELAADVGGRLRRTRSRLEPGEGRGHLGPFAELAGEARAGRLEGRDIPLDPDEPADLPVPVPDRRDGRLHLVLGAVRAAIDEPAGPVAAARQVVPQRAIEGGRLPPALEDARVLPDHLRSAIAGDGLERRVGVLDGAREVGDDHRVGRLLDGRGEPRPLGVGGDPLGDVLGGAEHADSDALRIAVDLGLLVDDPDAAVGPDDPVLEVMPAAPGDGGPHGCLHARAIVRMHQGEDRLGGPGERHRAPPRRSGGAPRTAGRCRSRGPIPSCRWPRSAAPRRGCARCAGVPDRARAVR